MGEATFIAVIAKVVPLSVEVNGVTGAPTIDQRRLGVSAADHAALAVARDLGDATSLPVHLFSVCEVSGEAALCEFAARGADHAVRLSLGGVETARYDWSRGSSSAAVAAVLADAVADAQYVVAGDHSLDRGSGSVPSRLAQRLEWAQILGVLEVDPSSMTAIRRLDAGWREQIQVGPRTVLSVEASAGRPPRASPT